MNGAVAYNVYVNAGRTWVWGDGTAGTIQYAFTNTGGPNLYSGSAYGTVPGAQDLAPGVYTDTLAVTMAYRPTGGGAWVSLPPVMLGVRMIVTSECRADTFNLIFGNYDPFSGAALNQSGTVKVYCTKSTPATFSLDNGANPSGAQKRMAVGASFLNYSATLASASGTSTTSLAPIGGGITLNGSVPTAQDVPIGSYIDTLQVLVNY
jgi:spore coat protein U-like protein